MSTTFGIEVPSLYDEGTEEIEVARRVGGQNGAYVSWNNPLAHLLPDWTPVIAMDNSAQGIYNIGDIKEAIIKQD